MATLPPDHMMQVGSFRFKFDIISSSRAFQAHLATAISQDLVRDVCDDSMSNLSEEQADQIEPKRYINIVQKSPVWLYLRSQAQGTASSVGKYIKGPGQYPSLDQIKDNWRDKINKAPFNKTHTMLGHMNWGVGYEDPALIHLAIEEQVGVVQVGTVRVDLKYILALGRSIFKDQWLVLPQKVEGQHLLISPDGIVGRPEFMDQKTVQTTMYKDLLGMLEIKCMSPFYHVEHKDGYLQWVDDIETRQWTRPQEIPFVYMTQMTLQAISGVQLLKMGPRHTMWFIRWSPNGLSIFTFPFRLLIRMGVLISNLYFSLVQRVLSEDCLEDLYPLQGGERHIEQLMFSAYNDLMDAATYKYVAIEDYPEFETYREVTQHFLFKVPEIDPDTLQVQLPKAESTGVMVGTDELNNTCLLG